MSARESVWLGVASFFFLCGLAAWAGHDGREHELAMTKLQCATKEIPNGR